MCRVSQAPPPPPQLASTHSPSEASESGRPPTVWNKIWTTFQGALAALRAKGAARPDAVGADAVPGDGPAGEATCPDGCACRGVADTHETGLKEAVKSTSFAQAMTPPTVVERLGDPAENGLDEGSKKRE